jgi:hypothetical protein
MVKAVDAFVVVVVEVVDAFVDDVEELLLIFDALLV